MYELLRTVSFFTNITHLLHYVIPDVFPVPNHRNSTLRNSFYLAAIYSRDSLPDTVCSSLTIGIFKGRLFRHLFDLENELTWRSLCLFGSVWTGSLRAHLLWHVYSLLFYLCRYQDSFLWWSILFIVYCIFLLFVFFKLSIFIMIYLGLVIIHCIFVYCIIMFVIVYCVF